MKESYKTVLTTLNSKKRKSALAKRNAAAALEIARKLKEEHEKALRDCTKHENKRAGIAKRAIGDGVIDLMKRGELTIDRETLINAARPHLPRRMLNSEDALRGVFEAPRPLINPQSTPMTQEDQRDAIGAPPIDATSPSPADRSPGISDHGSDSANGLEAREPRGNLLLAHIKESTP